MENGSLALIIHRECSILNTRRRSNAQKHWTNPKPQRKRTTTTTVCWKQCCSKLLNAIPVIVSTSCLLDYYCTWQWRYQRPPTNEQKNTRERRASERSRTAESEETERGSMRAHPREHDHNYNGIIHAVVVVCFPLSIRNKRYYTLEKLEYSLSASSNSIYRGHRAPKASTSTHLRIIPRIVPRRYISCARSSSNPNRGQADDEDQRHKMLRP